MNKQILNAINITSQDFDDWCDDYRKVAYKESTKKEFFDKIEKGIIVKNSENKIIDLEEQTNDRIKN